MLDNTAKKRKQLVKELIWIDEMLTNIFEDQNIDLEDKEGFESLEELDFIAYYRIKDKVDGGFFPRSEIQSHWSDYKNEQTFSGKQHIMTRWWRSFGNDPKDITASDRNWIRDKYPLSYESLQLEIQRNFSDWNHVNSKTNNSVMTSSAVITLKQPKYPSSLTLESLTHFVEELRVYKLSGGHQWNRNMLSDTEKSFIRRICLGQQATLNFSFLKNWDNLDLVTDEQLFNALASLMDSSGFHTSPFQQFLTATNTVKTIEYTSIAPLNLLLAERETLMKKLNLKILSTPEHRQLIKSFQAHVKLRGMSEDIAEKVKQIGAAATVDQNADYFKFTDDFYLMVETCVNSLRRTSQAYSPGLLANLFQATSTDEQTGHLNEGKPKKPKLEFNAITVIPPVPLKPDATAKFQAKVQAEKSNWTKAGNCQYCGRTPHEVCYFTPVTGKYPTKGNSEALAWNKSKQGIAYYKLGYYTAKPFHPKGYEATKKVLTTDAVITNVQVPKGDNLNLIYQLKTLLTNDVLKPRAAVSILQRNNEIEDKEVEALLDTGAQLNFISVKLILLLNIKTFNINLTSLFKDKNITSLTICGALAKAKCITATKAALLTLKHTNKNMPTYEAEFIVGEFSEDLIIGLPTLRKQNIFLWYHEIFLSANYKEMLELLTRPGSDQVGESVLSNMECSVALDTSEMRGVIAEDARKRVRSSGICQVDDNCVFPGTNSVCQTQPLETTDTKNYNCCEILHAAPISMSEVGTAFLIMK